jgi:iron complex outermembrane recepter protein
VLEQRRVEANSDFLAPPPTYNIWRIDAGFKIKKLTLGLSVQNVLNTTYREYLNRFRYFTDELGRNFSLRIKYRF